MNIRVVQDKGAWRIRDVSGTELYSATREDVELTPIEGDWQLAKWADGARPIYELIHVVNDEIHYAGDARTPEMECHTCQDEVPAAITGLVKLMDWNS